MLSSNTLFNHLVNHIITFLLLRCAKVPEELLKWRICAFVNGHHRHLSGAKSTPQRYTLPLTNNYYASGVAEFNLFPCQWSDGSWGGTLEGIIEGLWLGLKGEMIDRWIVASAWVSSELLHHHQQNVKCGHMGRCNRLLVWSASPRYCFSSDIGAVVQWRPPLEASWWAVSGNAR